MRPIFRRNKMSSFIENIAEKLHLIPNLRTEKFVELTRLTEPGDLTN